MKRIARLVFISLSSVFLFLTLTIPIISSHMQGYYKGLIDTMPENTQVLIEKKQTWVAIGETKIFLIIFLIFLFSFLITELIARTKKSSN